MHARSYNVGDRLTRVGSPISVHKFPNLDCGGLDNISVACRVPVGFGSPRRLAFEFEVEGAEIARDFGEIITLAAGLARGDIDRDDVRVVFLCRAGRSRSVTSAAAFIVWLLRVLGARLEHASSAEIVAVALYAISRTRVIAPEPALVSALLAFDRALVTELAAELAAEPAAEPAAASLDLGAFGAAVAKVREVVAAWHDAVELEYIPRLSASQKTDYETYIAGVPRPADSISGLVLASMFNMFGPDSAEFDAPFGINFIHELGHLLKVRMVNFDRNVWPF